MNDSNIYNHEVEQLRAICRKLEAGGRYDLILQGMGSGMLDNLLCEAAKVKLSTLVITRDHRFLLPKWDKEVELSAIHKALYILFLRHEEGIAFKQMADYKDELLDIYAPMCNRVNDDTIRQSVERLTNPLDNAINEKCSRIKSAFSECVDQYSLRYYAIAGHATRRIEGSTKIWYDRRKTILLPRDKVIFEV